VYLTQEGRHKDHMFKASQGYIVKPCCNTYTHTRKETRKNARHDFILEEELRNRRRRRE
jgi:hypothetical protein